MASRKYPSALFWVDLETTGLPPANDQNNYDNVEILEIAVIVTDFDLVPHFGYQGVVGMHDGIKAAFKSNPDDYVLQMHLKNGLLADSKASTDTLQGIETEIIGMLKSKSTQEKGEYMIAGSGVATFDLQLLKAKMPELASWLAYFPFDIGVQRRVSRVLAKNYDLVRPVKESFSGEEKAHRAMDDVKAHIREAVEWKTFYSWAIEQQKKG